MANEIMVSNNSISNGTIVINTIGGDVLEARVEAANAITSAESLTVLGLDNPFTVVNFIARIGVRNRTGEQCIDSFIITDEGKAYFSQSDGIANSLKVYVDAFTDSNGKFVSPAYKGYKFVVKSFPTQNGNNIKSLVAVKA